MTTLTLILTLVIVAVLYKGFTFIRKVFHTEDAATSPINQDNPTSKNKDRTAIVIGGSIAGLFTATTLSNHFKQVIIVEQKRQPSADDDKSIAPQGHHAHLLLYKGQQIIDRMYPGALKDLIDQGAVHVDYAQFDFFMLGGRRPKVEFNELEISVTSLTRGALERYIRQRVLKLSNVEIRDERTVTGLIFGKEDTDRVVGVRVTDNNGSESSLLADLVVDCSGTGTKTLKWLLEKYDSTSKLDKYQTSVKSYVAYCGVIAKKKEGSELGDREGVPQLVRYNIQTFPSKRAAMSYRIEGEKIGLLCQTLNKVPIPETIDQVEKFAEQEDQNMKDTIKQYLDAVDWNDAVKVKTYKKDGSVYNHFQRFPVKGFIAMGDSLASLNPVGGQGMTVVADECLILDKMLRRSSQVAISEDDKFSSEFQNTLWYSLVIPWILATSRDLRYKGTIGGRPLYKMFVRPVTSRILDRFVKLGNTDKYMFFQFLRMLMMTNNYPYILMRAKVVAKLLGLPEFITSRLSD